MASLAYNEREGTDRDVAERRGCLGVLAQHDRLEIARAVLARDAGGDQRCVSTGGQKRRDTLVD